MNPVRASVIAVLCLSGWPGVQAQPDWEHPGIPFSIFEIGNMEVDSIGDALYFCGESSLNNDFDVGDGAIAVYTNGMWDTLGVFHGRPQSIIRWHDTLIVSGSFNNINGIPLDRIGAYANGNWTSYGNLSSGGWIYRLKVIDDELYALGVFESMDGNLCNGLARREGGTWVSTGNFDVFELPNIQDLVKWNEQLVATGTIRFNGTIAKEVAILNGNEWEPLGPGIQGSFGAGRSLAVYQGDLFVSGSIDIGAGNAGHGIMRWDGSQYHPVGTGLQGANNNFQNLVGAAQMIVHAGLLFAGGSFSYAGNVPAPTVAYWNGTNWCAPPDAPLLPNQRTANAIAFFHDTLYISTYDTGLPASCALRFIGTNYTDTCSMPVGLPEGPAEGAFTIAPNPATYQVTLSDLPGTGPWSIQLFDLEGRAHAIRTEAKGEGMILLRGGLAAGFYTLVIAADDARSRSVARVVFVDR
jgi:hypothetical protein